VLRRIVDDVGPKPMPSAPSTIDAKKPANKTRRMSLIDRKSTEVLEKRAWAGRPDRREPGTTPV
jgi:hypothetical protein